MHPRSLITTCALTSIIFAIAGSIFTYEVIIPKLPVTPVVAGSGGVITQLQPEIMHESITSSDITKVAELASPSVVSIVISKEFTQYRTNPNDFFFNDPFGNDFFNDPFFGGGGQQIPGRGQNPGNTPTPPKAEKQKQQIGGGTGFIVSTDGKIMTNKHVRHLPVLENGKLTGLISIGDVVKEIISEHEYTIKQLENYITGSR